jgi:hypothetical protein
VRRSTDCTQLAHCLKAGFTRHAPLAVVAPHKLSLLLLLHFQVVKLNKGQRAVLLSDEGQVAAAFMKELVTINTQLKAPPCQ